MCIRDRDSFVLRPHLKLIEKYLDRDAWNKISQDELYEINTRIAPLVFDDEKDHTAKLFDLLTFEPVSYTHLDVYKRQMLHLPLIQMKPSQEQYILMDCWKKWVGIFPNLM